MLRGERINLRALRRSDVEALYALSQDAETFMLTDTDPYRPQPLEAALARFDKRVAEEPDPRFAGFVIEARVDLNDDVRSGQVLGDACLWGVDTHTRSAHIGISLLPGARGNGFGRETVDVLLDYGFRIRGLNRLQCETHADNAAMVATAESVGFRREGTLREAGWRSGRYVDLALFGLLCDEWLAATKAEGNG